MHISRQFANDISVINGKANWHEELFFNGSIEFVFLCLTCSEQSIQSKSIPYQRDLRYPQSFKCVVCMIPCLSKGHIDNMANTTIKTNLNS